MSIYTRKSGSWTPVNGVYVRTAAEWKEVQFVYQRRGGTWVEVYAAEVVAVLNSNTQNVNIQGLFSSTDWTSSKRKRVVVPAGVTIGSVSPSIPAMRTGTGWGGSLTVEVAGSLVGAGGLANSGVGGTAFQRDQPGAKLTLTGSLKGGGGGGGRGGAGGAGSYSSLVREPASGDYYSITAPTYGYIGGGTSSEGDTFYAIYWAGTSVWGPISQFPPSPWSYGGYNYYYGAIKSGSYPGQYNYGVYRTYTGTFASTGGAGGDGGRGAGSDGAKAAGKAGSAGGPNAGAGGTGGAGGDIGASGNTGNAGANGNVGNGSAAATGGLAGFYIDGLSDIDFVNNGTVSGRVR